jgi:type IV pilus assembly protein PilX
MLINHARGRSMKTISRSSQGGVVLIISLIVLVAMTLAALALIRSADTGNLIAGNMAFQQAATHSAELGVESAVTWLDAATDATLEADDTTAGYVANGSNSAFAPGAADNYSWDQYWADSVKDSGRVVTATEADQAGNTVSYIIDRLCSAAGAKSKTNCVLSPTSRVGVGNSSGVGSSQFNAPMSVYYRITVRVEGPRNTVSYVQSVVYK